MTIHNIILWLIILFLFGSTSCTDDLVVPAYDNISIEIGSSDRFTAVIGINDIQHEIGVNDTEYSGVFSVQSKDLIQISARGDSTQQYTYKIIRDHVTLLESRHPVTYIY